MNGFIIIGSKSHLAHAFIKIHPRENFLLDKYECDITNLKSIEAALFNTKYEYVLNCAAITDLNYCEMLPQKCFDVNTNGPKNIETICKKYNKKLIQISSDYAVNPVNVYGKSKEKMENILDKNNTLVLRTSFYYENYDPFLKLLNNTKTLGYSDLYFNPVSNYFLVKQIIKNRDKTGILNIFSDKKISKLDFLKMYCDIHKISKDLIKKASYHKDNTDLRRPTDSYIKPDISIDLKKDLLLFKKYSDKKEGL